MMRNKHNLYVSTPDWFTSLPKVEETIKTTTVTALPIIMGGRGSGGIGSVKLHNKAISKEKELSINDLTVDGYAVLIVELQPNPVDPEAVLPKPGEYISSSQWSSSKYIEVVEGSTLTFNTSYDTLSQYGIAFYDLTHKFIGGVAATGEEQIITVPTKSRYFRICGIKTYEAFKVNYVSPSSYTVDELNDIYENGIDPFTNLKYDYEVLHTFNANIDELSLVVDAPLKLELDSKNNIHLNLNDFSATGQFVTTTEEQQLVAGIKTFDNGIGIGEYLIVPDRTNNALRVVHRTEIFPLEDDPETEEDESLPKKFGNLYTSGWLSALGVSGEDVSIGGTKLALYELDDVLSNETATGVLNAEEGSVLTFNGSHWYATKIEHPKGMLEVDVLDILKRHLYVTETFLKEKEYLTRPDADKRYLLIDMFRKVFTLLDPNGVEITDFTNLNSEISEVRVNYGLWSTGFISALGKQNESDSTKSALYQLDDVLSNGSLVLGATKGSVLMFDGSHWYADIIKCESGISLQDVQNYLNINNYLKLDTAKQHFYTKIESDNKYLLREIFDKIFVLYDEYGNIIQSTDLNSSISNIGINYGLWSKSFISALGKELDNNIKSSALYQLNDVLSDGNKVLNAETGYVLTYDGSHWYASKPISGSEISESDVLNILNVHGYLTKTNAENLFYTKLQLDEKFKLYYTKTESDNKYLTRDQFKKIFTAYNNSNTEIDITDADVIINNISVNYGFWSKSFLSAKGKQVDSAINYLDYIDVDGITISKKNGYLEVIGGTGNNGGIDETLLNKYLTDNKYITLTTGDNRYMQKNAKVDADTIDEIDSSKLFVAQRETINRNNLDVFKLRDSGSTQVARYDGTGAVIDASPLYTFRSSGSYIGMEIYLQYDYTGPVYKIRSISDSKAYTSWRTLAFTDSDITGNAATATLATTASRLSTVSKTAWGHTYWTDKGIPDNISGDMSSVGNILSSGTNTYELGSSSNKWKNVHANCLSFGNEVKARLTTKGWYRFAVGGDENDHGGSFIFFIRRSYNNVKTESFVISATVGYGRVVFNQLSGAVSGSLITKVRATNYADNVIYFDLYYEGSTNGHVVYVNAVGDVTIQTPTSVSSAYSYTTEFTLGDGMVAGNALTCFDYKNLAYIRRNIGKNLLTNGDRFAGGTGYGFASYTYDESVINGRTYRLTICGKLGEGTSHIYAYWDGGSGNNTYIGGLSSKEERVVTITGKITNKQKLTFFQFNSSGQSAQGSYSYIRWAYLEEAYKEGELSTTTDYNNWLAEYEKLDARSFLYKIQRIDVGDSSYWSADNGLNLIDANDYALTMKRTSSSGGTFIKMMANNQTTQSWASGVNDAHQFSWKYQNGTSDVEKMYLDSSGNLLVTGGVTSYNTSDERLKENIRTFNAGETLMSLGGAYQFEYCELEVDENKRYEGTHIGLIYQKVKESALKGMCMLRLDGYGTLNYLDTDFISLLAAVGMEHEQKMKGLEEKVDRLERMVEQLMNK